jgi:hypothetical protein
VDPAVSTDPGSTVATVRRDLTRLFRTPLARAVVALYVGLVLSLIAVIVLAGVASAAVPTASTPSTASVETGGGPTAAAATSSDSCSTVVDHTAFREDNQTITALANGGPATSTSENTQVRIKATNGFYRVEMDNPNGYCVHVRVFVSSRAMDPASLPGKVESTDGNVTATWDAVHDFNTSTTYTRIEATIPSSTTAQFAPSQMRVKSLSWVSEKEATADGLFRELKTGVLGEPTVTKRHYRMHASKGEVPVTYTVRLQDPRTGAQLEEYHAMYSTDDGKTWQPVSTDTDAPVYKEETRNGSAVRFTFNEPASVEFTANPNTLDDAQREFNSYEAGAKSILDPVIPDDWFGGSGA